MKRQFSFLLALFLLVTCASAETIREQVHAPEHTTETFQSPSGRSHVYVDAEVIVPSADAFPIYEVMPRTFTPLEAERTADLLFGEKQWWHGDSEKAEVYFTEEQVEAHTVHGCNLYALGNTNRCLTISWQTVHLFGRDWFHWNYLEYVDEQGGFSQAACTPEEARRRADQIVLQVWPDMVFDSIDPSLDGLNDRYQGQYGYRVYYRRDMGDIPVTPVSMQIAQYAMQENTIPPLPYERLYVDVDADGIFRLRYEYPAQIGAVVSQETTLLPFSQIMSVFGQIAPLTIASGERGENNTLRIDRIMLGFMCIQMKDDPSRYQMIPVWDFFGTYSVSGDVYSHYMEPRVTINAIDGTVIDRKYGY